MECKDTAYRAISPDGLKGFPLEGKYPEVNHLGSEGNSQGEKEGKGHGERSAWVKRSNSVRTEKYFRAHENFSLCGRKQIFFRRAIPFLAGRASPSS